MPRRNRAPSVPTAAPFAAWEQLWQIFCPWVAGADETPVSRPARRTRTRPAKGWTLSCLLVGCALFCLHGPARAADPAAKLYSISLQTGPQAMRDRYPSLFGKSETRHANLQPFTKWSGVLQRFAEDLPKAKDKPTRKWLSFLKGVRDLDRAGQIDAVNRYMNKYAFVADSENYGASDYWATPMEFMKNGGDCEDYALAKYVSLRALGFREEELRLAIVYDSNLQMPHAVVIVYEDDRSLVLDNQADEVKPTKNVRQYLPIYSINQYAWWRH